MAIEGYDPDHYLDMALTLPAYDVNNLHRAPILRRASSPNK